MKILFETERHTKLNASPITQNEINESIVKLANHLKLLILNQDKESDYKTTLYSGLGGAWYVLKKLEEAKIFNSEISAEVADNIISDLRFRYLAENKEAPYKHTFLIGEVGLLQTQKMWNQSVDITPFITEYVQNNLDRLENEIGFGTPFFIYMVDYLSKYMDVSNFRDQIKDIRDQLLSLWTFHEDLGHYMWGQSFSKDRIDYYFGYLHGTVGNIAGLMKANEFLNDSSLDQLIIERTEQFLKVYDNDKECYNLPGLHGDKRVYVQVCHGAPGLLLGFTNTMLWEHSKLVRETTFKAGNLIKLAGPLVKDDCLCHGTSGNGLALIKLFEATGDKKWLDIATSFASHSIKCLDIEKTKPGLFAGSAGLLLFLGSCLAKKDISGLF